MAFVAKHPIFIGLGVARVARAFFLTWRKHAQGEKVRVVCYSGKMTPDIFAFHDLFLFPWLLFCIGGGLLVCGAGFIWRPAIINHLYFLNVPPANSLQSMGLIKS